MAKLNRLQSIAIQFSSLSLEEMYDLNKQLVAEIRRRRSAESFHAVDELKTGDYVRFKGRRGRMITGIVEKRNSTTVSVDAGVYGKWRVHGVSCEKITRQVHEQFQTMPGLGVPVMSR